MKEQVEKIVNEKIRPLLNTHGGDIEVLDVSDDGIVRVKLKGACAGCAGARATLEGVVSSTLRKELPQIKEVVADFM